MQFFRRSQSQQPPSAIQQALVRAGLPVEVNPATLSVLQENGSYAGRRVRYFRVFDPARIAEQGVTVRQYGDLATHPGLIVASGHTEDHGGVVLSLRTDAATPPWVGRTQADRGQHADDDRIVFPVPAE